MSKRFNGIGVVSGIAVGKIKLLVDDLTQQLDKYAKGANEEEKEKFYNSLDKAYKDLKNIFNTAKTAGNKEQEEIIETHIRILTDPVLKTATSENIEKSMSAPEAVLASTESFAAIFDSMEDEYQKARAADFRDIGKRIAKNLLGISEPELGEGPFILCAREVEPSLMAGISPDKVHGVIMGHGSTTSHAVIIAKSRELVTIVGLSDKINEFTDGEEVIIDGYSGQVILSPSQEEIEKYRQLVKEENEKKKRYLSEAALASLTTDGVKLQLAANIGMIQDLDAAVKYGAEGVGLFRTEFLFMGRNSAPTEEEQFEAYRKVVETFGDNLCVIRTMDIGGDKPIPYLDFGDEDNPFLGWRALRISLMKEDLFLPQLKAILRAGVYGRAAIMFPMIINLAELRKAKEFVERAKQELEKENKEYAKDIQVGIMVETPAAAVMAPILAKECDFFSIGTNDLVQYTLAVDRGNSNVKHLYSHFNPAVLRLIEGTIRAARENGIWSGMCGEMAGDPIATPVLLGMGINELSMSAPSIPKVKEVIRRISSNSARDLMNKVLGMNDPDEIKEFLKKEVS